jgi:hypothetical protein
MALERKIKIKQSRNAHTQYLVIPSSLVQDSQYPFKGDEEVEVIVDPKEKRIIVRSARRK